MTGAKRVPVATAAASKPGLRPRTALGDIGNKVSEQPQAKLPLKKVPIFPMQLLSCKRPPSVTLRETFHFLPFIHRKQKL